MAQVQKIHIAPVELKKDHALKVTNDVEEGAKRPREWSLSGAEVNDIVKKLDSLFLNQNLRYIGRVQVYLNQEDSACSRVSRFTFTFLL